MFFDALTMACVADELRHTILGGRVQRVLLPDRLSVGLEIYANRQRHYLLASAHAETGCLRLTTEKLRRGVERETGLLLLLRKYIRGAILSDIRQPPFERILHLTFDHHEWACNEMVVEVMGRHSNVIMVDARNRVLDAVKRVGPQISPARPVLPGQPYTPPPPQAKLPPSALTEYRLQQILATGEPGQQVWQALVKGLQGMSPLLAREIMYRALGHARATISQVEYLSPLLQAIAALLSPLENGQWRPSIVLEGGRPRVYAPYPATHQGEPQAVSSISQAIERYTHAIASDDPYMAAKAAVQASLEAARARLVRRREALERSLAQASEADQWREWGEWILAYAHSLVSGQTELLADTGSGGTLRIPLDPEKSAVDNAQACFARYRKAQRAIKDVPDRLEEANLALQDLDQLQTDLELAASRPEIEQVRAILIEAGHVREKKRKPPKAARSKPLSLTSPDGLPIYVGRNSRQNDEVTFRRAKGNDWWFHARGVPGAHVIVRSETEELPPGTIRRAAELAAYFSRLREEPDVTVDYTQRRHVRRIPRGAPGMVSYTQEQTTRVAPCGPD
jgi:predicted ribosome quality control (RQC) complex YloA/Tae2 family protein